VRVRLCRPLTHITGDIRGKKQLEIAILSDYKYSRCKYKQRYKYWCVRQNTAAASTSNAINIGAFGKGECGYVWVIPREGKKKKICRGLCHIQIYQKLSQH